MGRLGAEEVKHPAEGVVDHLGLGNDPPRTGHRLFQAEGTRRPSQERLRSNEITELRGRDAAKRKRVVSVPPFKIRRARRGGGEARRLGTKMRERTYSS
jgi:hypothetical protein